MDSVEVSGLRLACQRAGRGPSLVLLHGAYDDSRSWRRQMEGLWNGFTVFAWDAPGCGQSDDPSPDLTDRDLGDILAAVLQAAVKGKPHARLRRWSGASPRSHTAGMRAIVNALGRSDYRDALPVITIPALLL